MYAERKLVTMITPWGAFHTSSLIPLLPTYIVANMHYIVATMKVANAVSTMPYRN